MQLTELVQLLEPPNKHFDGYLALKNQKVAWTLSFIQGQLLYAEDELHAIRRWNRSLKQYFPNYDWHADAVQAQDSRPWQIRLLDEGINQQRLSLIRSKLMIRTLFQECLFELGHCTCLDSRWQALSFPISRVCRSVALSGWESKMTFSKVKGMLEQWQDAGLADLSPTFSPTLKKDVKASTLPVHLPFEHQYLRGDFTLWEIAGQLDQPLVDVAKLLMPLVAEGVLQYQVVPDLSPSAPQPLTMPMPQQSVSSKVGGSVTAVKAADIRSRSTLSRRAKPVIACIDDSPVLAHGLKKILVSAGYRALIIQEPMRGFSQLIEHKPSLILLDLMLPNADGYSVCKFLRDSPVFEKTPIIILTGQSKPIDRARARLAGATEFLVKPPQPNQLLQMIHDHLAASSNTYVDLESKECGM